MNQNKCRLIIFCKLSNKALRGGGGGVQTFHFGKNDFELGVQGGIWPILCQLMAILAKLLDMDFKFVFTCIYIDFDKQANFEVNQTQISHSIPKNTPKSH